MARYEQSDENIWMFEANRSVITPNKGGLALNGVHCEKLD